MAEPLPNGAPAVTGDVDMKMEEAQPAPNMQNIQPSNPSPQPLTMPGAPPQAEHLSTINPMAAQTPLAPANSARPTSMPPQPSTRPEKPVAHGGPTRQFLNNNITPHLLEGMKYLAVYEPEKPLLWLADFLRDRSKEVEG